MQTARVTWRQQLDELMTRYQHNIKKYMLYSRSAIAVQSAEYIMYIFAAKNPVIGEYGGGQYKSGH